MKVFKENQLRERAHFIAGVPSSDRPSSPLVESAIVDAIAYINALPQDTKTPILTGGTTVAPDKILTLFWAVESAGKIKTLGIDFLGYGVCTASWPDASGKALEQKSVSVPEALALNLPEMARSLQRRKSGPQGYQIA